MAPPPSGRPSGPSAPWTAAAISRMGPLQMKAWAAKLNFWAYERGKFAAFQPFSVDTTHRLALAAIFPCPPPSSVSGCTGSDPQLTLKSRSKN